MLRRVASKVMWVGRATVFTVGLAVIVGVVLGVATTALGANGDRFILGRNNAATAITRLTANVNGPAMQLVNTANPGNNDTALTLSVQPGESPLKVNSATKVPSLNADKLDGLEPSQIKGAKAYAIVDPNLGISGDPAFVSGRTSGFTSVERTSPGGYCLTAPGLSSDNRPAVTTIEENLTNDSANAAAIFEFDECGTGFRVETKRTVLSGGVLSTASADDVGFVIVVP